MRVVEYGHLAFFGAGKDNGGADEKLSLAKEIHNQFWDGDLHIAFNKGKRKGSIARLKPNDKQYRISRDQPPYIRNNCDISYSFYGICQWDGRKNTAKVDVPDCHEDIVVLLDYDGPTVWAWDDGKDKAQEFLSNTPVLDIDGHALKVGDKVMYINARYGEGATLDRGEVVKFSTKTQYDGALEACAHVVNLDGIDSVIRHSSKMIWRISPHG